MKQLRILIADDHYIVRMGLSALLRSQPGMSVVGEAEDGAEAVRLAAELCPDLVIVDLMMPVMDGVEATRRICADDAGCRVVILTTFGTSADLARAVEAGASGALVKDALGNDLVEALRRIAAGERVFSPEISAVLTEAEQMPRLTGRQMEVLDLVVRGFTNSDIARQRGISADAVKQHVNAIILKLGAANRAEAVAIALKKQLLKV